MALLLGALALQAAGSPARLHRRAANYEWYCSGACANATAVTEPGQGGVVLMGGGTDVGAAFPWMGRRSGGGGLLVLRTGPSGDDAYDSFILGLGDVSYAATLILLDPTASSEPFVLRKIAEASSIFFAGGGAPRAHPLCQYALPRAGTCG